MGPQGCALPIQLNNTQNELYVGDVSSPHVMSCQCHAADSSAQTITSLGEGMFILNLNEHIALPQSTLVLQQPPLPIQYGPPSELSEVPTVLWAKHKNHVGLVTSAPSHKVTLKASQSDGRY